MTRRVYEVFIYTLVRGYIHKGYCNHPAFIAVKRELDCYHKCWFYKLLKLFV